MAGPYTTIVIERPAIRAHGPAAGTIEAADAGAIRSDDGKGARFTKRAVRMIPAEMISA